MRTCIITSRDAIIKSSGSDEGFPSSLMEEKSGSALKIRKRQIPYRTSGWKDFEKGAVMTIFPGWSSPEGSRTMSGSKGSPYRHFTRKLLEKGRWIFSSTHRKREMNLWGAVPWPIGHIVTSRRSISKKEGDSLAITRREMRLETPRRAVPNYRHFTWKLLEKVWGDDRISLLLPSPEGDEPWEESHRYM